ncbi:MULTISPECIES: helix-turn-helix transcriptional regulator [unclassified Caballeronia]|uniref:helix-turn-helix domain-containing protein n=1 Tax=unclassified Caballeronia TaxID=2646786 RepID=UPI00285CEDF8|nr:MULTISPECIES: helix-turn-helix transcriptional regulator [unclassified Caballeronia]MDR5776981.1 helix-turn-helix transcriptional regulator [Caballeronia sp. LZ002]MDR5852444.1 helix-turn-helix transcriptional regulator [Caballeronia sp. LZ003]
MLPAPVERALIILGEHLRVARKRRHDSQAAFAERMQVSVPTLQKMEKGDPTVSMGVYASALWLIGRVQFLGTIADPSTDETALMLELRNLSGAKGKR